MRTFRADLVFCWFASVYGAAAVLTANFLGKRSIVVVGGVDVAREPEFGYGIWISRWKSALVGTALKRATKVLVVDATLESEVRERAQYEGNNIEVLPTGYDPEQWKPSGRRENTVLTVAAIQNESRLKIKGIDILVEVARRLPRTQFVLVGLDASRFPSLDIPKNLALHGVVDRSALVGLYQRARVYCQPSQREGLSNTLCEAMLCGCIPVATDVGGTANAVGDCGVIVRPGDPEALAAGIERAFALNEMVGMQARNRVISLFPRTRREQRLVELVNGLRS